MATRISGLEEVTKQLKQVEDAAAALNGKYDLNFDPEVPASVDAAIEAMRAQTRERVARYSGNRLVADLLTTVQANLEERIRSGDLGGS